MRLFRKKSGPGSDHQEHLNDLITSIRQARRAELEGLEEKPGLHSFVEDDFYPGGESTQPARVPPGMAKAAGEAAAAEPGEGSEAVADLEAYLTTLNEADVIAKEEEERERDKSEEL